MDEANRAKTSGFGALLGLNGRGQNGRRHVAIGVVLFQLGQEFKPAHARHVEIENDQIGESVGIGFAGEYTPGIDAIFEMSEAIGDGLFAESFFDKHHIGQAIFDHDQAGG